MGKSGKGFLRKWHLRSDLRMCKSRERVFQEEETTCANFLRSKHAFFVTEQLKESMGGLGNRIGDEAVIQPH